ncbi:Uncharacterised protein [Mycobacterium tuberculosis]|nr:Uncharacterised protein [Mycobacterium tuberculosis]
MNATEERLRDALKTVGDTIGPADVPGPRFTVRRRSLSRPVLAMAAVAASAAAIVGGSVLGGAFSPGGRTASPASSASPSPSGSTAPKIAVFLCLRTSPNPSCNGKDVTGSQKRAIRQRMEALPSVRAIELEDRTQTRDRFERRSKNLAYVEQMLKSGGFPESFRVTLAPGADGKVVTMAVLGTPGVDTVIVGER